MNAFDNILVMADDVRANREQRNTMNSFPIDPRALGLA
jgi:hypothetical protein